MDESITLISLPSQAHVVSGDRLGGEAHGVVTKTVTKIANSIPIDDFSEKFGEIIDKVRLIVEKIKGGVGGYEAEEITIGLAVTAEGDIGIATAGVEASIEVCLRRKQVKPS